MARKSSQVQGEQIWNQSEKVNAELFAFTYGSLVVKLIRELENISEVNRQLETMGYNIGLRLIDDFLSKNDVTCETTKDTAEVIAKTGFRMYLGVTCDVTNWNADENEFSLILADNPLTEFVELNEDYRDLKYLNLLCGVIRGALEMVRIKSVCTLERDSLKGDEFTELRVVIKEKVQDEYEPDDD
ncbi:unnamed protein product [Blepharisma stoltei]|uniref:Trafficking protein particle complex subunit n=1 Tax=Blepharisma stoltei TaxID=1481888 RepID=A0AAU9JXC5_9CILI|nr:unnamed protein product [Blepharisma stoltei]